MQKARLDSLHLALNCGHRLNPLAALKTSFQNFAQAVDMLFYSRWAKVLWFRGIKFEVAKWDDKKIESLFKALLKNHKNSAA